MRKTLLAILALAAMWSSAEAQRPLARPSTESGKLSSLRGESYVKAATYGWASINDSVMLHRQRFITVGTADSDSSQTLTTKDWFFPGTAAANANGMLTLQVRMRNKTTGTPGYTVKLLFSNDGANWTAGVASSSIITTAWNFIRLETAPYNYAKVVFNSNASAHATDTAFGECWLGVARMGK